MLASPFTNTLQPHFFSTYFLICWPSSPYPSIPYKSSSMATRPGPSVLNYSLPLENPGWPPGLLYRASWSVLCEFYALYFLNECQRALFSTTTIANIAMSCMIFNGPLFPAMIVFNIAIGNAMMCCTLRCIATLHSCTQSSGDTESLSTFSDIHWRVPQSASLSGINSVSLCRHQMNPA